MLFMLIVVPVITQVWCNEMVLFGKDHHVLELAHLDGARIAAEFVKDNPGYLPAEHTILESLELGSPELFQALLECIEPSTMLSERLKLQIVEKIVETGMVEALPALIDRLTDKQKIYILQFTWDLTLESYGLRIALWILQNYSEMFSDPINPINGVMHAYIHAFTRLDHDELSTWLMRDADIPDSDHSDRLAFDVLLLILQRRLDQRAFWNIFLEHKHALHSHNLRLKMLITLIENGGPADLLPSIIGKRTESSRLWLSFVEEKEINWRLVRFGRLDLLVSLVRIEFDTDAPERNMNRVLSALSTIRDHWKMYRDLPALERSKVGIWLRRFMEEDDVLAVRLIPMLGIYDLGDPVGQAAFQTAWSIVWDRGIFINLIVS